MVPGGMMTMPDAVEERTDLPSGEVKGTVNDQQNGTLLKGIKEGFNRS